MRSLPQPYKLSGSRPPQWQSATWEDYLHCCNQAMQGLERVRLFFFQRQLLVDMGSEGINHSSISDLLPILFFLWFSRKGQTFKSFGRCLIEKPEIAAASPDLVLYVGADVPRWQEGEPRRINLNEWRVPDLVGEVSDTSLANDLDEKKRIYAALGVPEYWVIDVEGSRVLAFVQLPDGNYEQSDVSTVLSGLRMAVLSGAIAQIKNGMTDSAALWFSQNLESKP